MPRDQITVVWGLACVLAWGLAGDAGAALTVVWNYAVSATLVWRAK